MADQKILYSGTKKEVNASSGLLETIAKDGVVCVYRCKMMDKLTTACLSWSFNWEQLKLQGIDGLTGHILITYYDSTTEQPPIRVDVDLTSTHQVVEKVIQKTESFEDFSVKFDWELVPHRYPEELSYEEMFKESENTDSILVIGDKKLYVSKAFLSLHSDFFSALFSSNFKEGAMNEVPIKDIFFKDFGLLISTIYPKNVFPNDTTVEKLLELADRFIMPSVFRQVENHLINVSHIENEKKMWMADKYSLEQLLKKTIHQVDTIEKAKKLKISSEYAEMSDGTKAKLFERLVQII
ncbi:hypothetical protein B9Z55_007450 [Caenorhabditis nigoni]|uniref:BTB domain-containing protein n=1 Tax=Caenorhabditis nigoni TaxID=1611254 RepID=A0A2G5VA19_9PELO|nr:hypothetical protein B9Z55_007450 [Caenorhabditis nigoni]